MKKHIILLLILIPLLSFSQDTLRLMHYNLLNFNNNWGGCTDVNNSVTDKIGYLKTIVEYVQPDILLANELACGDENADNILDNALNVDGVDHYERITFTCLSSNDLGNMIYFNNEKLVLYRQNTVVTDVRDINIATFYYNEPDLAQTHDTAYLHCIEAHLKAGSATSDEQQRASETSTLMNYLRDHFDPGNFTVSGDFNLYSGTEQAFQNLIDYSDRDYCFKDPINQIGDWNNNAQYAPYHTQSTHSSSNGCAASGGMDDRFDFILASQNLVDGNAHFKVIPESYKALAQDGHHFNKSITDLPTDALVPADVLQALFNNSDHLPVVADLAYSKFVGISEQNLPDLKIWLENPVQSILQLNVRTNRQAYLHVDIFSLEGRLLISNSLDAASGMNHYQVSLADIKPGLYLLKVNDGKNLLVRRLLKE